MDSGRVGQLDHEQTEDWEKHVVERQHQLIMLIFFSLLWDSKISSRSTTQKLGRSVPWGSPRRGRGLADLKGWDV